MQERQRYFESRMAKNQAQELLSKDVCCLKIKYFNQLTDLIVLQDTWPSGSTFRGEVELKRLGFTAYSSTYIF